MQLLVLGANGLLGSNVVIAGLGRDWSVSATYHSVEPDFDIPLSKLDIRDEEAVSSLITQTDPHWVVNCAAMTDVDGSEQDAQRAHAINAKAPGEIATACASTDCGFLQVSTDYVFDGESSEPYTEDDPVNAVQVYGQSKLEGERAVREAMPNSVIARLSFVYGVHRGTGALSGFPAWVRGKLLEGAEIPLFIDQHVTPSRAGQSAETLCDLIDEDEYGTFNVASRSCITPFEFGKAICKTMQADETLLLVGRQSDVDREAARPLHTCLDVSKVERALRRVQPTIREDLDAISDWIRD